MVVADAQEAAEAQYRVGHPAAQLVDHHALDRPDLLIIGTIHRGALDLVAADQISGLAFVCRHLVLSSIGACPNSRCSILSESDSTLGYEQAFSPLEYRSDTAAAAECAGLRAERPCLAVYR